MFTIKTIEWRDNKVILLDQRKLPLEEVYVACEDYLQVAKAVENMTVRGAPAIGVAAAYGVALGALGLDPKNAADFQKRMGGIVERLGRTRPTAVNLFWALERMKGVLARNVDSPLNEIKERLIEEAQAIQSEDIEAGRKIGEHGATLLKDGMTVQTHCNAGSLATGGFGSALSCVYTAQEQGKKIHVIADETRPVLQGARLTAWELQKHGVRVTLICDNMAGTLMQKGKIDAVIVGADRIAANGDTVNKIGTYPLAVLARHHNIPFYVLAPESTIDRNIPSGDDIPIEERNPEEVTRIGSHPIAPSHVEVFNPAFDKTPHALITAIVTERGIRRPPFSMD